MIGDLAGENAVRDTKGALSALDRLALTDGGMRALADEFAALVLFACFGTVRDVVHGHIKLGRSRARSAGADIYLASTASLLARSILSAQRSAGFELALDEPKRTRA